MSKVLVRVSKLALVLFVYWESVGSQYQPVAVLLSLAYFWWVWRVADRRWRRIVALLGLATIAQGFFWHIRSVQFQHNASASHVRRWGDYWVKLYGEYSFASLCTMGMGAILLAVADTGRLPFRRRAPRGPEDVGPDAVWPPPPRRLG